jgi:ATP-dependent Clp protease ATP-binding subunit ClpA
VSERTDLRRIMAAARSEARSLGSPRIEAEHLLLALTSSTNLAAGRLLSEQGLDHAAFGKALSLEFARSLEIAGVRITDFSLPGKVMPFTAEPRMAQSCKLAFHRAIKTRAARKDRRFDSLHLLLGILNTNAGTVARALDGVALDRNALSAAALAELDRAA